MTDTIDKAGELLRQRLREVEEEHAQLTKALEALGGSTSGSRRRGPRTAPSSGRTSRGRRRSSGRRQIAPAGQRREELIKYLTANPGARPVDIAKALNVTAANVQNVLRKALSDGVIEKQGRVYSVKGGASS